MCLRDRRLNESFLHVHTFNFKQYLNSWDYDLIFDNKLCFYFQPEPSPHSHLVNFAGLANFSLNKNGIYEEFQVIAT